MFDKLKLAIGKEKNNTFNLRSHVISTGEMGQLFPIRQIECLPGDSFDIDVEMFSRTAPLVVPTFGSVKFTTRAFFVPNRLIFKYWNEFITGNKVNVGAATFTPKVPTINATQLVDFFCTSQYGLTTVVENPSDPTDSNPGNPFDIKVVDGNGGDIDFRLFTNKGRYWLKVFNALGYKFNFQIGGANTQLEFSALPLFAFLRVYLEFYLPSQFRPASKIQTFFNGMEHGNNSWNVQDLYAVLDSIQLTYDNDYFNSAWKYPLQVTDESNYNSYKFRYGSQDSDYIEMTSTPSMVENDSTFSHWSITLAQRLANYVIRNNYAGSRAVEQILARFGVKVPDMEIQRPVPFGKSVSTLQIMDITNVAESEYAKLGSYGAKAIGYDKGDKMHIDCKEHGFIVLLASIMPETSQGFEGFDRNLLHLDKFDFYTPEFDGAIMQPVYSGELLSNYKGSNFSDNYAEFSQYEENNALPKNLFGFLPYATEYKVAHDNVIGDLNVPHLNQSLDAYHLFREMIPDFPVVAQSSALIYFNGSQYNRIFNVTDENQDHFYIIYRIKVTASRPMKSISESIPFEDNDIEHRNRVTMQANGSQYNN